MRLMPENSGRWIWPAAAIVCTLLLIAFGRDVVAGLLGTLALGFGLVLVLLILGGLLAMLRPGSAGALHQLPHSFREAIATVRGSGTRASRSVRGKPWRDAATIVADIHRSSASKVAALPSGPVAFTNLSVRLDPQTLQLVDSWMPVEDLAWLCAQQYADRHRDTPRVASEVAVEIAADSRVPRGCVSALGAFRPVSDARVVPWAVARCPILGPPPALARPDDDRNAVRLRQDRDHRTQVLQPDPVDAPTDEPPAATPLDTTVRLPAAGPRPRHPASAVATTTLAPRRQPGPAAPESPSSSALHVAGLRGAASTESFPTGPVVVGRGAGVDLSVNDVYVSRRHAILEIGDRGWTVRDLDSTHGTLLNGATVPSAAAVPLHDGDVLTLGRSTSAASFRISIPVKA